MGHIVNPDREHRRLQERLDRFVTGAPESPVLLRILKLLYSPKEAELARRLPGVPTPLEVLSRRLGIPANELGDKLTELARRGAVVDFEHAGCRYFALPPVVIGLFEFTFMRARPDMPMAELARLFDEYMHRDDRFARSLFRGRTQIGRALVHEEALPEDDHTEILDWERADRVIRSASAIGVSQCACRHKAGHLGRACDHRRRTCLSFNYAAETLFRMGAAEPVGQSEAMRILQECKEAGLAQIGDNVRRKVTYVCNCCGCCCAFMEAVRRFDIRTAVVTSNWLARIDRDACKGCGKCAEACPVGAIHLDEQEQDGKTKKRAVCEEAVCLGCGVCYSACKFGGIKMKPRERKAVVPETMFDRLILMAIERGKLADLLFDDPERLSHRALGRIVAALEKSPPYKAAMAIRPLRSVFLSAIVRGAKWKAGPLTKVVG